MKKLKTPEEIQDFLNELYFNFEPTLRSPHKILERRSADCFEGALLGAYLLSQIGYKPLIMYLKAKKHDYDHVIAPFKVKGYWGALSKTTHASLRYRDPVYKTLRELAMSFFHEYFLDSGEKTLIEYSDVVNLNDFEKGWERLEDDLWGINDALDKVRHYRMVPKGITLRNADPIEREAGKLVEKH